MSISNAGVPGQQLAALKIRMAGREVIASGTVITADDKTLEFELGQLRIQLSFVSDSGETRLGQGAGAGSALKLPLYNFNNPLGSGTTLPLEIGTLAGRKLWLSFMVYAIAPESSKTVHYTFSVGE